MPGESGVGVPYGSRELRRVTVGGAPVTADTTVADRPEQTVLSFWYWDAVTARWGEGVSARDLQCRGGVSPETGCLVGWYHVPHTLATVWSRTWDGGDRGVGCGASVQAQRGGAGVGHDNQQADVAD